MHGGQRCGNTDPALRHCDRNSANAFVAGRIADRYS
jgi:hypothetical protein